MRPMIALGLLLGTVGCGTQDSAFTLTGVVSAIGIFPDNVPHDYPGEIGVDSTEAGRIRVHIRYGMPIHIRSSNTAGDIHSFAVGDRVIMHPGGNGAVLKSDPEVWPIADIEIEK